MLTFDSYLGSLCKAVQEIDSRALSQLVEAICEAHSMDKVVYVCGNGGSAATASHMVNDLVKAPADASGCRPIRAIALTGCIPLMTAFANDLDYSQVFSRQVYALARPGDLLIAISGSGNSANVVEAAKTARTQGLKVAAMTGFEGGRLGGLADIHVNVPCNCIAQVEDAHLLIAHAIVEMLKERFGGKSCVKGF